MYYGGAELSAPAASNADGLPYVPYNDYLSYLPKGEAVLTASQADEWRSSAKFLVINTSACYNKGNIRARHARKMAYEAAGAKANASQGRSEVGPGTARRRRTSYV